MALIGAAVVAAAAAITQALIPKQTTTTTDSSGNSSSSSQQDVTVTGQQSALVQGSSTTNTSSDTKTTNSADPDVINTLKGLAQQAITNSNDPSKTTGLISGILQTAGDAMTNIFGAQKAAGGYSSSVAQTQADDTNARATADAASAVLGYQTNEQTIASDALKSLLTATATSDTATNSTSQTDTSQLTESNATTQTHSTASANQASATESTSSGTSSASIVCTWMMQHGYLDKRDYWKSMRKFRNSYKYGVLGYLWYAKFLLAQLERAPDSWASRRIIDVFYARTSWVCGRPSIWGFIATSLVFLATIPPGTCYLVHDLVKKESPAHG